MSKNAVAIVFAIGGKHLRLYAWHIGSFRICSILNPSVMTSLTSAQLLYVRHSFHNLRLDRLVHSIDCRRGNLVDELHSAYDLSKCSV